LDGSHIECDNTAHPNVAFDGAIESDVTVIEDLTRNDGGRRIAVAMRDAAQINMELDIRGGIGGHCDVTAVVDVFAPPTRRNLFHHAGDDDIFLLDGNDIRAWSGSQFIGGVVIDVNRDIPRVTNQKGVDVAAERHAGDFDLMAVYRPRRRRVEDSRLIDAGQPIASNRGISDVIVT